MTTVGLDFETYGKKSIKDVGLENYVTQPGFQVLTATLAYVIDGMSVDNLFYDFVTDGRNALELFKSAQRVCRNQQAQSHS